MTGTGFDRSALPNRRVMIGSLLGALVSGSLLGLIIGVVAPVAKNDGRTVTTAAVGSGQPTTPAVAGATAPAAPSASPSKTKFKPVKTTTLSAAAAPAGFIEHPEYDRTMFLATLDSMNSGDHEHVQLWVHPAQLLTGTQAQLWYASQGQPPRNVAVVPRQDAQVVGLELDPKAALWGAGVLGGGGRRQLGFDEFLGIANGVLGNTQHPPIWIKRSGGPNSGPVIYLAEQPLP